MRELKYTTARKKIIVSDIIEGHSQMQVYKKRVVLSMAIEINEAAY
jgi:hypothetical protein